jgi:hypothetical protein
MNGLGGSGDKSYVSVTLSLRQDEQSASAFDCLSPGNRAFNIHLIRRILIMKDMGLRDDKNEYDQFCVSVNATRKIVGSAGTSLI